MNINSSLTGTTTKDYSTTVSWRAVMNYAAAINDSNEIYLNDELDGGIVAHPMYVAALTWPISGNISEYIDSAKFPACITALRIKFLLQEFKDTMDFLRSIHLSMFEDVLEFLNILR